MITPPTTKFESWEDYEGTYWNMNFAPCMQQFTEIQTSKWPVIYKNDLYRLRPLLLCLFNCSQHKLSAYGLRASPWGILDIIYCFLGLLKNSYLVLPITANPGSQLRGKSKFKEGHNSPLRSRSNACARSKLAIKWPLALTSNKETSVDKQFRFRRSVLTVLKLRLVPNLCTLCFQSSEDVDPPPYRQNAHRP